MSLLWNNENDPLALLPKPATHTLKREGLAGARGSADGKIGVLIDLGVERVNDAQGVVVPVEAQQDTVVVR